ncbi:LIM zinc-binding domain-containing Nebulette-like [Leptonychotes weddellii]|uniref:LIM zinc-binding domain-containing Nebulette-like n=1 Tax=Leptonychotes weddellii TaxID=9713 RepID=A0A7F8RM11_LEPWE|nr:LIM zinc-binding domain-containing Nebulette-like [Leptonychotes weddellii]
MNPQCARCGKVVYPTEKVNCLDKYWHKGCFHCEVCKMALNMNNYKGYEKKPYCNAHYPKQSFTTVADTPENLRLKQQSELQSQLYSSHLLILHHSDPMAMLFTSCDKHFLMYVRVKVHGEKLRHVS